MSKKQQQQSVEEKLFQKLSEDAQQVSERKTERKDDRVILSFDNEDEIKSFERWAAANAVLKITKGHEEASQEAIMPKLKEKFYKILINYGKKIENPVVQTNNARSILILKNQVNVSLPQKSDGTSSTLEEVLRENGVKSIFAKEVASLFSQKTVIDSGKSISELKESNDKEDQQLANKLMQVLASNKITVTDEDGKQTEIQFSIQDRKKILKSYVKVAPKDPDEVLNSVISAASKMNVGHEQLGLVFATIRPTVYLYSGTYTGDLTEAVSSLISLPIETKKGIEFVFKNKKYLAESENKEARLYVLNGKTKELLGKKECTSTAHALKTCQKWQKDNDYLEEFIEKN